MTNGHERFIKFWFGFDDAFNPTIGHPTPQLRAAVITVMQRVPNKVFERHRDAGTYPDGFQADMEAVRDPLRLVSAKQVELLDAEFAGDADAERTAFELFGQGVLFDKKRPEGDKIHKMDFGIEPPDGYHTWHAAIRASVMFGADAERWLQIDRNVGLAWAIQSEARPIEDDPDNPELPAARLEELRSAWRVLSFEQLDREFDSSPFPAGLEQPAHARVAASGYKLAPDDPRLEQLRDRPE